MFNGSNYSLSDIAAVTGGRNANDNGFGGWGDGWWIILLFLIWGNNNWNGNGNGGGSTVREEVAYGFDINGLDNSVRGVQQGLCDGFYAMNTGMLNGFSGVQSTLCQGFAAINSGINSATNGLSAQLNAMASDQQACCQIFMAA